MLDIYFPLYAIITLLTFTLTALIGRIFIPFLKKVKAEQPIYSEGPQWHLSKSGTPTMGGVTFLISVCISLLSATLFLYAKKLSENTISILICVGYGILNSTIGIIDDLKKLHKKENKGLSASEKIILQSLSAILFLLARYVFLNEGSTILFSFGEIQLGIWYYPITLLILIGITNCANLTDGIDGLASCTSFAICMSIFYISCALNLDTALISSAIIGAVCAFLIFNVHPAKVFMGDTGSLFLGSLSASMAVALKNPLLILSLGGIYVIEGASVIIQVVSFKLRKKRVFKMAPLHHHLEKCGWSENRICISAIIASFVLSIPAYIFYLP